MSSVHLPARVEQQPVAPPTDPIAVERIQLEEEERVAFGCPEEGCIKVYQSHSSRETPSHVRERVHVRRDEEKVGRDLQVNFW